MIAYGQALQSLLDAASGLLPVETLALEQAVNRISAAAVHSGVQLPPFNNSAMDGFALHCPTSGLRAGAELAVSHAMAAGDQPLAGVSDACEIMTGAAVPEGCTAVIPIEQVCVLAHDAARRPQRIRLQADVASGQHLRLAGEDVERGDALLVSGTRISPAHVMLLSGAGVAEVTVRRRPRIALIATGRELIDDPGQPLLPGQIRNSNAPYLSARLQQWGAQVVYRATVADDPAAFIEAVKAANAQAIDLLISTGAVSMGRFDFIPDALRSLGADILFHKVAIRPGKPILLARQASGILCFGLPGNPISTAVGLRFFIEPTLRALSGMPLETPITVPLAHVAMKKAGFRMFQKARVCLGTNASVALLKGQESFKTQPMLYANAWAVLPETEEMLEAGTVLTVYPLAYGAGWEAGA